MPKILKVEKTEDGNSYQIDFGAGMVLWFDIWHTADGLTGDWNQYIFSVNNEHDQKVKDFQEASNDEVGAYNYMTAIELCEEYEENNK